MSQVQFRNNKVLFTPSGQVALDPNCCCGECICTVIKGLGYTCPCIETDYGAVREDSQLSINITGSMVATAHSGFGGSSSFRCLNGETPPCVAIAGSYVINRCNGSLSYCKAEFICTEDNSEGAPIDHYQVTKLDISAFGDAVTVAIQTYMGTQGNGVTNDNPTWGTCTGSLPTGLLGEDFYSEWEFDDPGSTHNDWVYEIGGSCQAACNTPTTRTKCATSAPTFSSDFHVSPSTHTGGCDPSGLGVAITLV